METKVCLHCHTQKPLDHFIKNKSAKSGIGARCLSCEQERTRQKRARPGHAKVERERNAERMRQYRQNPTTLDKLREINRKSEAKRRQSAEYRDAQRLYQMERRRRPGVKEAISAYMRRNKARFDQLHKEWVRNNRPRMALINHRRRARLAQAAGSFTLEEWLALCEKYDYKCLRCKRALRLTVDHVIPIVAGGANSIENIQPLCKSCNSAKGTKTTDYRLTCDPGSHQRRSG